MYNQPEIRYSKNLHVQKEQFVKDLSAYLEYLADIQAGITLTVDRPMVIDEVDQVVAPGRRRVREELVKPGSYRLRAFRRYHNWRNARPRLFDYEYCFVLDITKQGINGSEFQSEIWFENASTLEHILRMQFTGSVEIVKDRRFPGTVSKITFTHSNHTKKEQT